MKIEPNVVGHLKTSDLLPARGLVRVALQALSALLVVVPPAVAQSTKQGTNLSVAEVVRQSKDAVVLVRTFDGSGRPVAIGSGFIAVDGRVVTNAHVLEGATSAEVVDASGVLLNAAQFAEALSVRLDIAVLPAVVRRTARLSLFDATPEVGEQLVVIGAPEGLTNTVSNGILSAVRTVRDQMLLQLTAPISAGSSGGPVLTMTGKVAGIAAASLRDGQNLNFAIAAHDIRSLLGSPKGRYDFPPARRPVATVDTRPIAAEPPASATPESAPVTQSAFILTQGADTIVVERLTRGRASITGDLTIKGQSRMIFTAEVAPGPFVPTFTFKAWGPGADISTTPLQTGIQTMTADSARITIAGAGGERRIARAINSWPIAYVNNDLATTELVIQRARAAGTPKATVPVFSFNRGVQVDMTVEFIGADSAIVGIAGQVTRFGIDQYGYITGGVLVSQNIVITRVDGAAVDKISIGRPNYGAPAGAPHTAGAPRGSGWTAATLLVSASALSVRARVAIGAGEFRLSGCTNVGLSDPHVLCLAQFATSQVTTGTTLTVADAYLENSNLGRLRLVAGLSEGMLTPKQPPFVISAPSPHQGFVVLYFNGGGNRAEGTWDLVVSARVDGGDVRELRFGSPFADW